MAAWENLQRYDRKGPEIFGAHGTPAVALISIDFNFSDGLITGASRKCFAQRRCIQWLTVVVVYAKPRLGNGFTYRANSNSGANYAKHPPENAQVDVEITGLCISALVELALDYGSFLKTEPIDN